MPPIATGRVPWVRAGLGLLRDPTAFFVRCRDELGDTFVADAFGYRLFCVFSAEGVRALYSLPERVASKGFADYALLRHKVPDELFAGRRNFPHHLFGSQEVETYLDTLEQAVRLQLDELGSTGAFEIFTFTRRLGHRLGLASWAGVECASAPYLDRLISHLDRLDASESFVHPISGFVTWATDKRRERAAMYAIEAIIAEVLARRASPGASHDDFLARIVASWADAPAEERVVGVARDVMLIHMGSQSNLYAAMAWTLVHLLLDQGLLERVCQGDDSLLEQCANEAIRMSQRSLTLRYAMQPAELDDGKRTYRVDAGAFLATMLSVTNTSSAPGLDQFEPLHYEGRRLRDVPGLETRELVSTFGHGRHSCPAQRFAISAIRISLRRLLERYELEPRFRNAQPLKRQIGGVARSARPCEVAYRAR